MTEISAFLGLRPRAGPPRNSLQTRVESSGLPKSRCRLRIDLELASIWGMSVYECSFAPELWPGVLDELAQIAGARGGVFFAADLNTGSLKGVTSACLREIFAIYASEGWLTRKCPRNRLYKSRHAGFLTEDDLYLTAEELDLDHTYRDFLRPRGLGWTAGTGFPLPTGNMIILNLERDYACGPVESAIVQKLDTLRPHLARSVLMSAQLKLERASVASETLALIRLPALVFDDRGRVLAANHLIEARTDHIRWRAQDRVSLKELQRQSAVPASHRDSRDGKRRAGALLRRSRRRRECRDGRACYPFPRNGPRHFHALRRSPGADTRHPTASTVSRTGPVAVRSDPGGSARRPQFECRGNSRENCLHWRCFA